MLSLVEKTDAACVILVVFIDIHQNYFISSFLKELLGNHNKVRCRLGNYVDAIDNGFLDCPAFEVDLEILGGRQGVEVKVKFSQSIVLCRGEDKVELVGDAALPDKAQALVGCLEV